jgi:alanine racemase
VTRACLTVDLDALAANYRTLRNAAGVEAAPAVKADGYGLGAAAIAARLWSEGARRFFVARAHEGEQLRADLGDRDAVIYVLDGATPGVAARLAAADLTPVLNSLEQVEEWSVLAGKDLPAALHVDTGINRLGVTVEEAEVLARKRPVRLDLVMSHLACAGLPDHPLNATQLSRFQAVRDLFPDVRASFASSAGIFLGPDFAFDQVRPGISLYGGGPRDAPDPHIRPVATLEAPVLQVRDLKAGDAVGYGATFVAERPMRAAIVATGYAEGYPRNAGAKGHAWIAGGRRRLLGRVSMDMLAIDVTDTDVWAGDKVELLGANMPVDEVALAAGTIAYEVLTRMPLRAKRVYRGATQ